MKRRQSKEDPAHYSHSLLTPKRLKSIWHWLLQPDPCSLLTSQHASNAHGLDNLEPVRPDQPGVSFTAWVRAVLGSSILAINPCKLSAQQQTRNFPGTNKSQ